MSYNQQELLILLDHTRALLAVQALNIGNCTHVHGKCYSYLLNCDSKLAIDVFVCNENSNEIPFS